MLTFTIVKPRKSPILHHFRSRMLWKSTNDHFYNSKTAEILHFHIIVVHLSFENRPMLTFAIVNRRKSCILHHFRSRMLWKSIIHRSAWGNPVGIDHRIGPGISGPAAAGPGRLKSYPTPWPANFFHPPHPHTQVQTRIDFINPDCHLLGKKGTP